MDRPSTKICLNMIVKNEEKVLPRLFRSLKDYVDYYVIVDTGSSDDTIALIGREMGQYGIPGEVHQRPWVNFGVNRQQALELAVAADRGDWLLFIDADEELGVSDPTFYEKLEPGVGYDIEKHHGGVRYAVPHLINIRAARYRWEGPVHNYLQVLEGPKKRKLRKDVWIVYHHAEGAKSHGVSQEEKFLRDARILEDDLAQNPGSPRSQFYLAQSYRDAVTWRRRSPSTRSASRSRQAGTRNGSSLSSKRVASPCAWKNPRTSSSPNCFPPTICGPREPSRSMSWLAIFGCVSCTRWPLCLRRAGVGTPRPDDSLFVAEPVYQWRLLDELGVSSYWVGDYGTCKTACEAVLARIDGGLSVPEADVRRVKENLAAANEKFGKGEGNS